MWMKHLTIVAVCLLATTVYGQRTRPTRKPTTEPSLITTEDSTSTPAPVSGQGGCLSNLVGIQSSQNYLVVTKRGRRRSFERRHPGVGSTIIQSDGSGRELPVTIVDNSQVANMVRKLLNYS